MARNFPGRRDGNHTAYSWLSVKLIPIALCVERFLLSQEWSYRLVVVQSWFSTLSLPAESQTITGMRDPHHIAMSAEPVD